ncbi:hypothetical protein JCM8547_006699 [Rhodosporidiobolus lusitaniae]
MTAQIPGLPPCPPPIPLLTPPPSLSSSSAPSPQRRIFTPPDLQLWPTSTAYRLICRTILRLVYAVKGKGNDEECGESPATRTFVDFLHEAKGWIKDVPLQTAPQRFGNKAFRVWVDRVAQAEPPLLEKLFSFSSLPATTTSILAPELASHLLSSLGSPLRLDYGTGHELSFLSFLSLLFLAGTLTEKDEQAVATKVFGAYFECVREAQKVFRLEPAGSKGVWGLDDFQHLSYLFGASQLIDHPIARPSQIPRPPFPSLVQHNHLHSSLSFIHTLKRGPFHEHSPLLHQISTTVPNWQKCTKGLWEMYKVEVLGKLPVVQHVRFGVGLSWTSAETGEELPSTGGDGKEEGDDPLEAEKEDGPVLTPAPWASPASSSSSALNTALPPPPSSLPESKTTSSFAASSSSSSSSSTTSSFTRRQHPTNFPLPPPSSAPSGRVHSFAPPVLFPPRRSRTAATATVAEEGGAAAGSSPFGVLPKAKLGGGGGEIAVEGLDEGGRGVDGVGTKAPWAE